MKNDLGSVMAVLLFGVGACVSAGRTSFHEPDVVRVPMPCPTVQRECRRFADRHLDSCVPSSLRGELLLERAALSMRAYERCVGRSSSQGPALTVDGARVVLERSGKRHATFADLRAYPPILVKALPGDTGVAVAGCSGPKREPSVPCLSVRLQEPTVSLEVLTERIGELLKDLGDSCVPIEVEAGVPRNHFL